MSIEEEDYKSSEEAEAASQFEGHNTESSEEETLSPENWISVDKQGLPVITADREVKLQSPDYSAIDKVIKNDRGDIVKTKIFGAYRGIIVRIDITPSPSESGQSEAKYTAEISICPQSKGIADNLKALGYEEFSETFGLDLSNYDLADPESAKYLEDNGYGNYRQDQTKLTSDVQRWDSMIRKEAEEQGTPYNSEARQALREAVRERYEPKSSV